MSAILRIPWLGQNPYVLDELWSLEIASGRGSLHLHLPIDGLIDPPPAFFSLATAPPWWHVWTHMEVTHPPFYSLLLRLWDSALGDTDFNGRLFSVTTALVAVAALFDVIRLQAGLAPAAWAALLMCVAVPQVEHARLARSYMLLIAIALLSADALTRIQLLGMSRRRWCALTASIFLAAFTHYFCFGALLGLLFYAVWKMPRDRLKVLAAFITAAAVFAVIWGPFMWQQRGLFSTSDPAAAFLLSSDPHHGRTTLLRFLLEPVGLLFPVARMFAPIAAVIGVMFYLVCFVDRWIGKTPFVLMWGLWLLGTVGIVTVMDLARGTDQLYFIRYTLLAGPAVYALLVLGCWGIDRRACHFTGAVAVILCAIHLPVLYARTDQDPRRVIRDLRPAPDANDLLIVASGPADVMNSQVELFRLARYLDPLPCSVALLTGPANPELLAVARRSRFIFLCTRDTKPLQYFPGAHLINANAYHGLGHVWTLRFDR